jgi:hypothetical protein
MQDVMSDQYLITKIKLAVCRTTDIGDQIEIRMVNNPAKVVLYKILDKASIHEIKKVKQAIEAEAKLFGMETYQDKN